MPSKHSGCFRTTRSHRGAMVRVKDDRYVQHWGLTTLADLIAQLRAR